MTKTLNPEMSKVPIKPRYFTPNDAFIINPNLRAFPQHRPILLNPQTTQRQNAGQEKKQELDGFFLLEAANLDFPEDVQHLSLANKGLGSVVEEDLTYFAELFYLDVSENNLPFISFGALPKLKEFRMACNNLHTIEEVYGFSRLMYLDLSYNRLSTESILALAGLPQLKELDLCGNDLTMLPSDLSNFYSLEKLLLEYNKFDNNRIFQILSTLPNIRHIDLSHNYLSFIPRECFEYGGLRLLEILDIAFNFFGSEESIEAIVLMGRLKTLILYGNPVLGPTGEDPMFIYIEELIEKSSQVRRASESTLVDVEFLTEIPRKRIWKKGQPLGRFSLYRDFSVVQVDTEDIKNEKPWRKKGVVTPFVEAMNSRKQLHPQNQINDNTFITNSINPTITSTGRRSVSESEAEDTADVVMQKIALEMGLVNNEELELFENYAVLPPTITGREFPSNRLPKRVTLIPDQKNTEFLFNQKTGLVTSSNNHNDDESIRSISSKDSGFGAELIPGADHLPNSLFNKNGRSGMVFVPTQPIALRTAMKELQRSLNQPLTDYDQIPSKALSNSEYSRGTIASKQRQLPRITLEQKAKTLKAIQSNNILTTTPAFSQFQKAQQQRTLQQIDSVLDNLNDNSEKLVGTNDEQINRSSENTTNVKKTMENMRNFAKPQSVRGLVSMVHNIIEEFNS